jgi:hypothetical protein
MTKTVEGLYSWFNTIKEKINNNKNFLKGWRSLVSNYFSRRSPVRRLQENELLISSLFLHVISI